MKNTNIEFYLEKGYSLEESKLLRNQRQSTFSKEKCILKHGTSGLSIWKNRQLKWKESLSKSSFDEKLKDSSSVSFFKEKYGNDWLLKSIDKNFFCNKELIKTSLMNSYDFDSFCEEIFKNKNIYSVNELSSIYNSSILKEYFGINEQLFKQKLLSKYGLIPHKFGNIRYFNGHICRSNGEYYIAKKLKGINIDYEYEKKYPNSNFISDFYIPKYNLYIEYMGFLKTDYMNKNNIDICDNYSKRYDAKREFCERNNINFIFETDYKLILKKIIDYDYNN